MLRQENSFETLVNSSVSPLELNVETQARRRRRRRRKAGSDGDDEHPLTASSSGASSPAFMATGIFRSGSLSRLSLQDVATNTGPPPAAPAPPAGGGTERPGDTPGQLDRGVFVPRQPPAMRQSLSAIPLRTRSVLGPLGDDDAPAALMSPIQEASNSPHHPAALAAATPTPFRPRDARPLSALGAAPAAQGLGAYIAAELRPGPSYPVADVLWGQTERDRVYNALMAVPYQLERLVWFGTALCLDSFLAVFTLLPIRVGGALWAAARCGARAARRGPPAGARGPRLRGDQLFDLLCACMFVGVVWFLWRLDAGAIYFWVKELTQEFLKLSLIHTALELGDKICCSFGVDVLEALAASCTALTAAPRWSWRAAANVASDAAVASALLVAHGAALMSQALVFGVAMNSQKNTLLALLIASNFTEIKGTVLKRFDPSKLFVLACQDVVERFHLLIVLAFVLVEDAGGAGARAPSSRLLRHCCLVLVAEAVIDVTKHAVLGKFNEIRPGVYREFMKDLCERVAGAQSHSMHRLVGFEPFAPAALFLRVALTYAALRREGAAGGAAAGGLRAAGRTAAWCGGGAAAWLALVAAKTALGFLLKRGAVAYLRRYEGRHGRGRGAGTALRLRPVGLSPVPSGAPPTPGSPKKDI